MKYKEISSLNHIEYDIRIRCQNQNRIHEYQSILQSIESTPNIMEDWR